MITVFYEFVVSTQSYIEQPLDLKASLYNTRKTLENHQEHNLLKMNVCTYLNSQKNNKTKLDKTYRYLLLNL